MYWGNHDTNLVQVGNIEYVGPLLVKVSLCRWYFSTRTAFRSFNSQTLKNGDLKVSGYFSVLFPMLSQ